MSDQILREAIDPELRRHCRALKLSPMLDTLPERLALARQRNMTHQDFMILALGDEVQRRAQKSAADRAKRGQLDPQMRIETWDPTAQVTFDRRCGASSSACASWARSITC